MVNKKGKGKFFVLTILGLLLAISVLSAITFQNIFPTTTPYVTNESTVNLSYGIHAGDGLSSITHSWNGTNTTLYDSSLVLFMNFDNRSELGENDTLVRDLSMYENNGTVVGGENITWGSTYGKYGGAFNFSGNKGYINITKETSSSLIGNYTTTPHSFSFWIYIKSYPSSGKELIRDSFSAGDKMYRIQISAVGQISYYAEDNASSWNYVTSSSSYKLQNNSWNHVVLIPNRTAGCVMFYINNQSSYVCLSGSKYFVDLGLLYSTTIGYSAGTDFFNGSMDEVMIFNKSLSTNEVNYLYSSVITKYNESYFEYNTTKNIFTYLQPSFLCTKNATADEFCSVTQNIRQLNTIKANFSENIFNIKSDFYGTSVKPNIFTSRFLVDKNNNGTATNVSDLDFYRSSYLNSNLNNIRKRMNLNNYYTNLSNQPQIMSNVGLIGDLSSEIEFMTWAKANNLQVIYYEDFMPNFLYNKSSSYCNSSMYSSCPPYNYSLLGNIIANFTQRVGCTSTSCIIEPRNEPDILNQWLNNLSKGNITRYEEYIKLFNATNISLNEYGIKVCAGTLSDILAGTTRRGDLFMQYILANSTADCFSFHMYTQNSTHADSYTTDRLNVLIANCSTYNSKACNDIKLDEYNKLYYNYQSEVLWGLDIALGYAGIFSNSNYSNVTTSIFSFADEENTSTTYYDNYNFRYVMLSEAGVDETGNRYYPPYNVTKNFAHLCPAGATVSVTSNDDASIKQVSCKKGNMYSLIVINTDTQQKNVTLNMSMENGTVIFPYASLRSYEDDDTIYKVTDGITQLGVMDSYEILYLYSGLEDGADLRGVFKLNEGSGNTIYDSLQNLSNGVKSGATWFTDSVLVALTNVVDYSYTYEGVFTINNSDYYFEYIMKNYVFQGYTVAGNIIVQLIQGTASFGDFWEIIVLALVIVIVLTFLIKALSTSNKR